MKYTREDEIHIYATCDYCGRELHILKQHCIKDDYGFTTPKKFTLCPCGKHSNKVDKVNRPKPQTVKKEQQKEQLIRCIKCSSTQIVSGKKGFSLGKAALGGLLIGPFGLLGGLAQSNKLMLYCMNCGHGWEAGNMK